MDAVTTKRCPLDSTTLVPFTHEGHQMDRCPRCGGLWFTCEEFATLVRVPDELQEVDVAVRPEGVEPPGTGFDTCPVGHGPMLRFHYVESKEIVIDRCTECRGIWLDDQEAAAIAARNREAANPNLTPEEQQVVAEFTAQHVRTMDRLQGEQALFEFLGKRRYWLA